LRLQPIYDLADVCAQWGIREVVICPGSRSAPLTLAFVRHGAFRTRIFPDERSAAYIALGMARSTRKPVVLICTSGTAALNFAPAVSEAFFQQVPLLVLTADRPAEWTAQQDGQTIYQESLYGRHVKKALTLPADYTHPDSPWMINRTINEALALSTELPHGPVHINVPLREPLYPTAGETFQTSAKVRVQKHISPDYQLAESQLTALRHKLGDFGRILVVAGQHAMDRTLREAVARFVEESKAVLVGDILSNLHAIPENIRLADNFLPFATDAQKKALQPDLLITFGQSIISKQVKLFLRQYPARAHWHIQEAGPVADPYQSVDTIIRCAPSFFFQCLTGKGRTDFSEAWRDRESRTQSAIASFLAGGTRHELGVVHDTLASLPAGTHLHLANSMVVRYANFIGLSPHQAEVEVFSNRGTSGIDGCTSSAMGHALTSDNPQVLMTGDMAFLYDRNAFWHNYNYPALKSLVLNNHGGIIFNMIDGPGSVPEAQEYFVTRQHQSARTVAEEYGHVYHHATESSYQKELVTRLLQEQTKPGVLEFESSQEWNVKVFQEFKKEIQSKL
jgi:2-succinyl-5-enolpyruvyl-6-hydroxy-3-cyclohexene-1-carboxylate synthase